MMFPEYIMRLMQLDTVSRHYCTTFSLIFLVAGVVLSGWKTANVHSFQEREL